MSTPFLGEIRIMSFNYAPKGWAQCNGQLFPINQNQALFSLLGTMYGGNGQVNFALPNLQGQVPMHVGQGFVQGQAVGEYNHVLALSELPQHTHFMKGDASTATSPTPGPTMALAQGRAASTGTPSVSIFGTGPANRSFSGAAISNNGGGIGHPNQQPYLTLNFCIALQGIFPTQN
jgi:microcystin-dependent protein